MADNILLVALINKHAVTAGIEPAIVYGVVKQESAGNPYAMRYEKDYKWLFNPEDTKPHNCSLDTEITLQKFSFGLMQVMGAVFRELGYKDLLSKILSDPDMQLYYGCKFLSQKIGKYGRDEGILAYNSGSPRKDKTGAYINQYYLDNVIKYSREYLK